MNITTCKHGNHPPCVRCNLNNAGICTSGVPHEPVDYEVLECSFTEGFTQIDNKQLKKIVEIHLCKYCHCLYWVKINELPKGDGYGK